MLNVHSVLGIEGISGSLILLQLGKRMAMVNHSHLCRLNHVVARIQGWLKGTTDTGEKKQNQLHRKLMSRGLEDRLLLSLKNKTFGRKRRRRPTWHPYMETKHQEEKDVPETILNRVKFPVHGFCFSACPPGNPSASESGCQLWRVGLTPEKVNLLA